VGRRPIAEASMADMVLTITGVVFFVLAGGYASLCERL
jgi:hypothetical protein